MLTLRPSLERGYADHGWLKSFHSFSFAGYFDPAHMGWGNLRVINEDRIAPETGFGTHGHQDMEIISYVLSGELNHAHGEETHFLQIWLEPNQRGVTPSYEQKTIAPQSKRGALALIASASPSGDAVKIHADAALYAGLLDGDEKASLALNPARKAYVFLIRGALNANGQQLKAGDALLLSQESQLNLSQGQDAEVLVFDLAP